ncbi:MAG: hypothetical protein NVSMB21_04770 [Vulcanimicrobiaceae bacterium]
MKRLARLGLATGLAATLLLPLVRREAAQATPFSDVPANHWAYQYIQSLAADGVIDGYPDGKFKGDRPLTRYEMAVVVARVVAKLQENQGPKGPSKEDLDKLQKLIDALKDELDALGVRVTNLEDSLDALDKRTKFAQSLSLHGVFLPNVTFRQRDGIPRTVTNTTGAAVPTYYGTTVPGGTATNPTAVGTIDPFVNAFLTTDDSNNPLTAAGSGIAIRQDSRFSLAYQINDNLTVSLPVHILNYEYGGEYSTQNRYDLEPGIDVTVAKTGAISNLQLKFGIIDNMTSSRTGLAFRAPQGYNGTVPYLFPAQPFQKGAAVRGTIGEGAFGTTDFEASFTRVDQTLINTQNNVVDPSIINLNANAYFTPVVVPQIGFVQTGAAAALRTDTFNAGGGALAQAFLTQKAVNGSVYVSYYNGATYNSAGVQTGGPATPLPGLAYNDVYNSVVFGSPLPAGSVVGVTYRGLTTTNNTNFQRYMARGRLNQKFKGYAGAEVGFTFTRIFDFDDSQTTGSGANGISLVNQNPVSGNGAVSDTVLGLDFQLPLPYLISGAGSNPVIFGEAASSKFTGDYRNVAAIGDTAGVLGVRLKVRKVELSAQFQSVGENFFVGAPFRYFGNPPPLFAFYKLAYLPDFIGFGNNVGINQQFDNQFTNVGLGSPKTAGNPNLSFVFPMFNTLKAQGPQFYSSLAPNSRGFTTAANAPIRVGDLTFTTRFSYQHLEEIRPNSLGALLYGPAYATNEPLKNDTYTLGTAFQVPVFGQKANVNLNGSYETLKRLDPASFAYVPINPATQTFDGPAFAASRNPAFNGGLGSAVSFHPNYVDVRHITLGANVAVPLTKDLVGSASYNTQRFGGAYGTTTNQNISERKDYYSGSMTYNIPKTNSSVSFLARHYGYTDDVVPNVNLSQNRQDLNFTVRF